MKRAGLLWFFLLALFWRQGIAQENAAPKQGSHRVVTATRLVAVFSEQETALLRAVQQKDGAVLGGLLGEDFQELSPNGTGPLPREEWQSRAFAQELQAFRIRQMAVRALTEDTALVSFVLNATLRSGEAGQEQSLFIVDLWSKTNGRWACAARYASAVSGAGEVANTTPSGKR